MQPADTRPRPLAPDGGQPAPDEGLALITLLPVMHRLGLVTYNSGSDVLFVCGTRYLQGCPRVGSKLAGRVGSGLITRTDPDS